MTEQAQKVEKPAPPPEPLGFGELLEMTMTAVPYPGVFVKAAPRPAPGYPAMLANIAAFWALRLLILFVRELVAGTPGLNLALALLPAVLALVAALCFSLPGAVLVHGLSRLAGGTGDFSRSFQVVSMASSVAVLDALLSFSPSLWPLGVLLAAWLTAEGTMALHAAPAPRARTVFAMFAAVAVAMQWQARKAADRMLEQKQAVLAVQQAMRQLPLIPGAEQALKAGPALAQPGQLPSSLDLLSAPDVPPGQVPQQLIPPALMQAMQQDPGASAAPNDAQIRQMQQSAVGMLDTLLPMFDNPAFKQRLGPEQAKDLDEIKSLMLEQKKLMASGKRLTKDEEKAALEKLQKMQGKVLSLMMNQAPQAAPKKEAQAQ